MVEILKKMEDFEIKTTDLILEKVKKQLGNVKVDRESNSFIITVDRNSHLLLGYFRMFYSADDKCWSFDVSFEVTGYYLHGLICFNEIKDDNDLNTFSDNYAYVFKCLVDVHTMYSVSGVPYYFKTILGYDNPFNSSCPLNFYLSVSCNSKIDEMVKVYEELSVKKNSIDTFNEKSVKKLEEIISVSKNTVHFLNNFVNGEILKLDLSDKDYFIEFDSLSSNYFYIRNKKDNFVSFSMSSKLFFDDSYDKGYLTDGDTYFRIEVCDYISFLIPFNKVPLSVFSKCFINIIDLFYNFKNSIDNEQNSSLHSYSKYYDDNNRPYVFPMVFMGGIFYRKVNYNRLYDEDVYPLLYNKRFDMKITHVILNDDDIYDDIQSFFEIAKRCID